MPRSTSSFAVPRNSNPALSPAMPSSSCFLNISTPVTTVFARSRARDGTRGATCPGDRARCASGPMTGSTLRPRRRRVRWKCGSRRFGPAVGGWQPSRDRQPGHRQRLCVARSRSRRNLTSESVVRSARRATYRSPSSGCPSSKSSTIAFAALREDSVGDDFGGDGVNVLPAPHGARSRSGSVSSAARSALQGARSRNGSKSSVQVGDEVPRAEVGEAHSSVSRHSESSRWVSANIYHLSLGQGPGAGQAAPSACLTIQEAARCRPLAESCTAVTTSSCSAATSSASAVRRFWPVVRGTRRSACESSAAASSAIGQSRSAIVSGTAASEPPSAGAGCTRAGVARDVVKYPRTPLPLGHARSPHPGSGLPNVATGAGAAPLGPSGAAAGSAGGGRRLGSILRARVVSFSVLQMQGIDRQSLAVHWVVLAENAYPHIQR